MSVILSSVMTQYYDTMPDSDAPVVAVKIMPAAASTGVRRAFHLVLVIDTSGSMDGQRIVAVKRTLNLLVDAMAADDILTVIRYSTDASILADTVAISDESRVGLHATIDAIRADGGTNMESAFLKIREVTAKTSIDSVFVMTDGQINQGCTSSTGLIRILSASVPNGTPVNTLGYGHDHNSRLLRDIGVRSRGTYTYADSDELIPAIIGDIMGGLAAEVGRNGKLLIPAGWKCMELGSADDDTAYSIGTLIAEKPQWVVLKGPVKSEITELPTITFTWQVGGVDYTGMCEIEDVDAPITAIEATEQELRARVAVAFGKVSELLEAANYTDAKTALEDLAAGIDASIAKDRTLVIQMRAQIDDMLDTVNQYTSVPSYSALMPGGLPHGLGPNMAWPMPPSAPLQRQVAVSSSYYGIPPPPALAPVLSRLASNTATLGMQRGIISGGNTALTPTFSSPAQRQVSSGFTQQYLHDPYDPDFHANTIAPASPSLLAQAQGLSAAPSGSVVLVGAPTATPTGTPPTSPRLTSTTNP